MPNNSYLRGRRLEWAIQNLFKSHGYSAMRTSGSHGFADVIVTRKAGDATDLMRPITKAEIDEVLAGWLPVHNPNLILDPFLYGKIKPLRNGGTQMIHFTPATVILMQMKTTQPKKRRKAKS
ncbi:MAG: hypothetical protein ABT940_03610 [Alphaproteobacteria bacterium]